MKENEELLQRCFDGDLSDREMKKLFGDLSIQEKLREQFRAFQRLRNDLQTVPVHPVPVSLDLRIQSVIPQKQMRLLQHSSVVKRFVEKRFSVSIPAIAATLLVTFAVCYAAAIMMFTTTPAKEYVYVVELPAYVVKSNHPHIINN